MLLKLFWQTIVFGFMYVVASVALYISSSASVTYMRYAFLLFLASVFPGFY